MSSSKLSAVHVQVPVTLDGFTRFARQYSNALEKYPVAVKSMTSGFLSAFGNIVGQGLQSRAPRPKTGIDDDKPIEKGLNWRSVISYLIFGTFVNGPVAHFYINLLERYGPKNSLGKLFFDRFIYGPVFLYITLYLLNIFQGASHRESVKSIRKVYWNALKGNLKIWVICQYINFNFVPLQYRTLVSCCIAVVWNIYLSGRTQNA